jgi:hypothetical protein
VFFVALAEGSRLLILRYSSSRDKTRDNYGKDKDPPDGKVGVG